MRFAIKLIVGGAGGFLVGAYFLVSALTGSDRDGLLTGAIWKGPLAMVAGAGAVFMGIRWIREYHGQKRS